MTYGEYSDEWESMNDCGKYKTGWIRENKISEIQFKNLSLTEWLTNMEENESKHFMTEDYEDNVRVFHKYLPIENV